MGRLSTHVLDTSHGRPAAGVAIELFRIEAEGRILVASATTNRDGRTDEPLMQSHSFTVGAYELVFDIGAYFRSIGTDSAEPAFLDLVPVRFSIAEPNGQYHVPLLVSPWSYSTYRGS
jgi:5-hydroxyisourate hydrolase